MQADGTQPTRSAIEVFEQAMHLAIANDLIGFADLFAPDGIHELPFAPPGVPRRVEGRDAIRSHFAEMADRPLNETGYRLLAVHQTANPEVIVVELDTNGVVTATGEPYDDLRYVEVIQVRKGQIVLWRDYWNPLASAEASGRVGELLARYPTSP